MVKLDSNFEVFVFRHKVENTNDQLNVLASIALVKIVLWVEVVGQVVLIAIFVLDRYCEVLIVVEQSRQLCEINVDLRYLKRLDRQYTKGVIDFALDHVEVSVFCVEGLQSAHVVPYLD